jgi:PAS domain S-box-containing protein
MDTEPDALRERHQQLIEENRRLVQRCLELEAASRQQLDKLRAANAVLTRGEADLRALLENATIAFALTDPNLRIASANQTMARIIGYSPAELPGINFTNFVYVGKLPAFNRLLGSDDGAPGEELIELVARDGALIPCRIVANAWLDDGGVPQGPFILVFDAGPDIVAAGRLRDMERSMAETEKSRALFMEVVSRELRAPASGVVGMSRMLLDAGLTPRQAELAGVIHSSAGSLVRLVDDMVDVANLVPGEAAARPEPVAPNDLALGVANLFSVRAEEKGLKLGVNTAPAVPNRVMLDPHLLRRVLAHLIDNSVKFTESGCVTLAIDIVGSRIRFMVSDTGPGVDPEVADALFPGGAFPYRPPASRHGGIGVGLVICRRLVAAMGGSIGHESEPGRGSEFHFSLPLVPARPNSDTRRLEAPVEAVHLPPLSILVADANPISSRFIQACLLFDGHSATLTDNGVDAAEKCRDHRYDLVVLDSLLPKLDGLQTLRLIREDEKGRPGRRTPALIMTSGGQARALDDFHRAGADGVVAKPLDIVRFMNALARAAGVKPLAVSRAKPPALSAAGAGGGTLRRLDGNQLVNLSQSMPKSQFAGIMRHFMDDVVPDLLRLGDRAGAADPDHERLAFAAAKGRGLAGYLGFAALADVLKNLERAARAGAPRGDLLRVAGDIAPTVDDSLEEMRRILPETFALISDMRGPMED